MTYATQDDLTTRFGAEEIEQLTDRAMPQQGAIVAAVVDRALADADAVINRYLGARYAVPLTPPLPQDVGRVACDLARYFLHDQAPTELARDRFDDAIDWLRQVGAGKLPLVTSTGGLVPALAQSFGPSAVRQYSEDSTFGAAFAQAWRP